MPEIKDASVGVVFMLKGGTAALQRRAAGQSMQNGHQLTAHKKLDEEHIKLPADTRHRDSAAWAIGVELGERLSQYFATAVAANEDAVAETTRFVNPKGREVVHFTFDSGLTAGEFSSMVSSDPTVAGFTVLSEADLPKIRDYRDEEKRKFKPDVAPEEQTVPVPQGELAMFPDEKDALVRAFEWIRKRFSR